MSVFEDVKAIVAPELKSSDLGALKSAFDDFIAGSAEEQAAAKAIATHVKEAAQAFMDGTISRHSLQFVLEQARDTAVMMAETSAIELRRAAIKAFFKIVIGILVKRL